MGREVGQAVEEGGEEGGGRPLAAPAAECAGPSTCRLASGAAFPGAATRRARAGRRSRCRRWTRAGCPWTCPLAGARVRGGPGSGQGVRVRLGRPRQGLLMAGSAAPATRGLDPRQRRPGGRSAGRKPHPAHASLWPHRSPLPQRRRTLFQPPRAPPGSRRPHQQATTRITGTGHRLERLAQHALHLHHLGTARTT